MSLPDTEAPVSDVPPEAPVLPEAPRAAAAGIGDLPHLKRLQVSGFKAFGRPLEFDFHPGITGIVGPNGCGKSNVVDAIRWVLGEQSPRSLRGSEMQDVIFRGAEGEPASGCAEVTLTFSNCRGTLSTDHDEVSVGRRLYRSGESEYFLNQQDCRLKDIRELFLGTGAGMEAYSIVEQGKVDALLTSNTLDRRAVFDEVAGISLYRLRVRQARSKLERVGQDLSSVENTVKEVEAHLAQIRRQARKAEVYRAKAQRLGTLRLTVNRHRHAALLAELASIATELAQSGARLAQANDERARLEADRAVMDAEQARLDQRRMALHTEVLTAEGRLNVLEKERTLSETRRQELEQEAGSQEARAAEAASQGQALSVRLQQARRAVEAAREALQTSQGRAVEAKSLLAQAQSRFESRRALEARAEEARARSVLRQERRNVLASEISAAREEASQTDKTRRSALGRLTSARSAREGAEAVLRQVERDLEGASSTLTRAQEARAASREALARLEARAAALEEAREPTALDLGPLTARGIVIRGRLSDLIQADVADAAMLDAALGDLGRALVVDTWDDAGDVLTEAAGKSLPVSCLVLEAARSDLPAVPSLADRVRCEEFLRPLVRSLLGGVDVVASLPATPSRSSATPRGDYAGLSGVARHVGNAGKAAGTVSGAATRARVEADRIAAAGALKASEAEAASAEGALPARREALGKSRADLEKARAAEAESQRHAGEGEARAEMAARRVEALAAELTVLEQAPAASGETLPSSQDEGQDLAGDLDAARGRDAEARVEQVRLEGELHRAEGTLREDEGARHRALAAGEESARLAAAARQAMSTLLLEAERRVSARKELEGQAAVGREALSAIESEARQSDEARRISSQSLRDLSEVLRRLEDNHQGFVVRQSKAEANRASLLQQCRENYGWSEEEVGQSPDGEGGEPLDPAAPEGGLGPLLSEIEDLDGQIKRMGPVNLEALEEEEALDQRAKALTGSRDDLKRAGASLEELIQELDTRSEAQFLRVFEEVKVNFQELFRRLFGGGRADVILENPAKPLDSGIEIIARPPGREPMPISLLSGGQKALSAVALIFAFFRSRPSPFYILDEVDAPLDESNIDRFLGLLQEFAKVSQFLIITHNRRTMRTADTLHGVTMQTPGISTRLSVRFEDIPAHANLGG